MTKSQNQDLLFHHPSARPVVGFGYRLQCKPSTGTNNVTNGQFSRVYPLIGQGLCIMGERVTHSSGSLKHNLPGANRDQSTINTTTSNNEAKANH